MKLFFTEKKAVVTVPTKTDRDEDSSLAEESALSEEAIGIFTQLHQNLLNLWVKYKDTLIESLTTIAEV